MLKKILIAVAALIVLLLMVVAVQPGNFRVTRSVTINAPASAVSAQVDDFHRWTVWSPFEKQDPAMKRTFEGPAQGVGSIYRWAGNDEVGEGNMTILESKPGELVRIKLEFIKPFAGEAFAEFTFVATGNGTTTSWSMSGHNNFICKAMGLIMNMDKMLGGQFEQGLATLKTTCEAAPKP